VVSGEQMLTWLDARNRSYFTNLVWNGTTLSFTVQADANARGLETMVPVPAGYTTTQLNSNGIATGFTLRQIKGMTYAQFPATTAHYEVRFAADTQAPSVVSTSPGNGEDEVSLGAALRVVFSKAMNAATINSNTLQLFTATGNLVPSTVTYNGADLEAVVTPISPLAAATTYRGIVNGGSSGARDLVGNPLVQDYQWNFTTVLEPTVSIWPATALPATITDPDTQAIEVGVKFRTDAAGYITGLRFYKGPANTGVHVGNLWSAAGTNLSRVTFSNETATGWQEQRFAQPVPIYPNTTYVASYFAPNGAYSSSLDYFAASGVTNSPLRALSDAEAGGNGVYRYGTTSQFPNLTYRSENYWVDVMFKPGNLLNTAPAAGTLSVTVPEDTVTNLLLPGSDAESPVVFSILAAPTNGTLTGLNTSTGAVTYQPNANFFGADKFTYRVSDGSLFATGMVEVTVLAVNDPPVAGNLTVAIPEDTITNLFLVGSDAEYAVTFAILSPPKNGVLSAVNPSAGAVIYSPNSNYFGADLFTYQVSDGSLLATGSVNMTVAAVDDPPRADILTISVIENTVTNLTLSVSDLDTLYADSEVLPMLAESSPNAWTLAAGDSKAGAVAANDGDASYIRSGTVNNTAQQFEVVNPVRLQPDDAITSLQIRDTVRRGASQNANFIVSAVVDGTVLSGSTRTAGNSYADFVETLPTRPDGGTWTLADVQKLQVRIENAQPRDVRCTRLEVLANFVSSRVHSNVVYAIVTPPVHGTLTNFDADNGQLSYAPAMDYVGPDVFSFSATVGGIASTGQVNLAVLLGNGRPHFDSTPATQTTPELALLTVTNTASDADTPATNLTYQLLNAPAGATISPKGVITWLPSEAQGPSTNQITTVVSDGQSSVTNSFSVIVSEISNAPEFLMTPSDRTMPELTLLTVTNSAIDPDLPANLLTYQLLTPPAGAGISSNGVITWTPGEAEGPSSNVLITVVSDGELSVTNQFTVVVDEVNAPPLFLAAPVNCTVMVGEFMVVTNTATDADLPANVLSYKLLSPPMGATINTTGIINWTPAAMDGGSTNAFMTVAQDGRASVTNEFWVVVAVKPVSPTILALEVNAGVVMITWSAQIGQNYLVEYAESLPATNWTVLLPDVSATNPIMRRTHESDDAPLRFYRLRSPR
jgi:hypothetical protein